MDHADFKITSCDSRYNNQVDVAKLDRSRQIDKHKIEYRELLVNLSVTVEILCVLCNREIFQSMASDGTYVQHSVHEVR